MSGHLRRASTTDAEAIAAVLAGCWPDDNPDPRRIASLIGVADRVTLVGETEGQLSGMVDTFGTTAPDGTLRWEIDLLAVSAAARGRGMAKALVSDAIVAAPGEAHVARALVRLGNRPAERTFAGLGFVAGEPRALFTAAPIAGETPAVNTGFTRVDTLTYSGVWIERRITEQTLLGARALALVEDRDRVGAVVMPGGADALCGERVGYQQQGIFRWWTLVLA